ncbi:hypothetical protein BT67DRAFT_455934 [Trichocladium antarcticum]|uniref:Uncharacterized protein n=1 Tax=Trichocladium antarcticum TaxID=1450529 RepID=A0AAN6UMS2_9PEZI|nr:hypothetical protein BT67DRAFT_455934 [Trichocladium antarcticum]
MVRTTLSRASHRSPNRHATPVSKSKSQHPPQAQPPTHLPIHQPPTNQPTGIHPHRTSRKQTPTPPLFLSPKGPTGPTMETLTALFLTGGAVIHATANTMTALLGTLEADTHHLAALLHRDAGNPAAARQLRTVEARLVVVRQILAQYVGAIDGGAGWNAAARRVGVEGATRILKGLVRGNETLRALGGMVAAHRPVAAAAGRGVWWVFGGGAGRGPKAFAEEEVELVLARVYGVSLSVEALGEMVCLGPEALLGVAVGAKGRDRGVVEIVFSFLAAER